ncbi:MAG: hypothetical protein SFV51_09160 [Bryobacteraceae bacterium]|nr:hypothetical protein [Bryobacteraceae bacterium]
MNGEIGANLARIEAAIAAAGRNLPPSLLAEAASILEDAHSGARHLPPEAKSQLAERIGGLQSTLRRAERLQNQMAAIESVWADVFFGALAGEQGASYSNRTPAPPVIAPHRLELEA